MLAYVIMPNHIHFLLHHNGGKQSLNTVIGNGKRFIAYEIVKLLKKKQEDDILRHLQKEVEEKDRSRGKKHEVWKNGFDVKECRTENSFHKSQFTFMKILYGENGSYAKLHLITWIALRFYFNGTQGLFNVKDYCEFSFPTSLLKILTSPCKVLKNLPVVYDIWNCVTLH